MTEPNQAAMTDKSAPEQVELLACPFCGSRAERFPIKDGEVIECSNLDCNPKPQAAGPEAIAAWNTRIQSQRPSPGVDVDLVERVAVSMCRASRPSIDPYKLTAAPRGTVGQVPLWTLYEHMAKAAIASMPDERKLIVDWLNGVDWDSESTAYAKAFADSIERGQHISATVEG